MNSVKVEIFFSCSFRPVDQAINDFFRCVCEGLDMSPNNVSGAYNEIPPDVAKQKITESGALIAVCVQRDKIESGGYIMPPAIRDEISFASAKDTPVLMFVEEGVNIDGFHPNMGTHLRFNRLNMHDSNFIKLIIQSIHSLKLKVIDKNELYRHEGVSDAFCEYAHALMELRSDRDDFVWEYSGAKKLVYTRASRGEFPWMVWVEDEFDVPDWAPPIEYDIDLSDSSNGIKLLKEVKTSDSRKVQVMLKPDPGAEAGDFIEYTSRASSRYFNAVWSEEAKAPPTRLERGTFLCTEGWIITHRTKKAVFEFRITKKSLLRKGDLVPFVGSHTWTIDYEIPSELDRINLRIEEVGLSIYVRMEVENPLVGCMYGIAWNPKPRPAGLGG